MDASIKIDELTYENIFDRFVTKYPTFKVDDYRPAADIGYSLLIWEKGTNDLYFVQYQPLYDEFLVLGKK